MCHRIPILLSHLKYRETAVEATSTDSYSYPNSHEIAVYYNGCASIIRRFDNPTAR